MRPGGTWGQGAWGETGDLVRLGPGSAGDGGRRGGAWDPGDWSPGREGVARGGDPVAVTLPLGLRAGPRAAGCWLRGPAPPPIRLQRLGACSRRRLRCQQTPGASLPGPPLSNSELVPLDGSPRRTRTAAAEGSGARGCCRRLKPGLRGAERGWAPPGREHAPRGAPWPRGGGREGDPPCDTDLGPALTCGPAEPERR